MSIQQTPQSRARVQYAGADQNGKARIATRHQLAWFADLLERDPAICNNCFAKREDHARHFRGLGGATVGGAPWDDANADRFCSECEAGMGVPTRDAPAYFRGRDELPPSMHSEMAGTISRDWDEETALPKEGGVVSLSRLISRIGQRLEERGYVVEWDAARELAEELKDRHPNRDRVILARVFAEHSRLERCSSEPRAASLSLDALTAD